ncbi:MBL fold metallo-hydrolase [Chloroflexota bacterium]
MQITILGSGGGFGIPNAFCHCANCLAARAAGGKSLRHAPSILLNDDLLIDCGPDVINGANQRGIDLHNLRTLVITHRHADHIDPWFFWGRRGVMDTDLPLLTVYAPQDVLDYVFGFYQDVVGLDRAELEQSMNVVWQPVRADMMKLVGPYRLHFFQATHGLYDAVEPPMGAVLLGVQDSLTGYLHCYDSGPLLDETWMMLSRHQFDVAAIDSCIHLQEDYISSNHMTAEQTLATAERLRSSGILKPTGTALATHFVHQAAGRHEELVEYYEPRGLMVAYDGMVLEAGQGGA